MLGKEEPFIQNKEVVILLFPLSLWYSINIIYWFIVNTLIIFVNVALVKSSCMRGQMGIRKWRACSHPGSAM